MSKINHFSQRLYAPFKFSPEAPIYVSNLIHQSDTEITYLHYHNCFEIGYCYEGEGIFVIENKVFPFRKGDISLINHKEVHLAQSSKGTTSQWKFISINIAEIFKTIPLQNKLCGDELFGSEFKNIISAIQYPNIEQMVLNLIQEIENKSEYYHNFMTGILVSLFAEIYRNFYVSKTPLLEYDHENFKRIQPSLEFIANHYQNEMSIDQLARLSCCSTSHFRRLFVSALHVSPQEYIIQFRIKMAASLLRNTDRKIITISHDVGFASISSLNRNFKRIMKMTPKQW
jgi:AraC-like DNA-binding protein